MKTVSGCRDGLFYYTCLGNVHEQLTARVVLQTVCCEL